MQTFLPLPDFHLSARRLDQQRLGKQRGEAKQLLLGLLYMSNHETRSHPASKMWCGYELALCDYGIAICEEWRGRGFKDQTLETFEALRESLGDGEAEMPPWINGKIHENHRGRLLEKLPGFYMQYGWKEQPTLINYWPEQTRYELLGGKRVSQYIERLKPKFELTGTYV